MKMTMKEWCGYLDHQCHALFWWVVSRFTGIRYVWFISREKYCFYNRVETAPPFSLVWHLQRMKESQTMAAITSVENAPHFTREAVIEAWKNVDVAHTDITEKSDG